MSCSFYKKSSLYLFGSYIALQIVICYLYGGWLVANIFEMDHYQGMGKIFLIATDISILLAALLSLSSFIIGNVNLIASILMLINAITYLGIIVYDFLYPPESLFELLIYTLSSLLVIITFIFYQYLIYTIKRVKNDNSH